MSATSTAQNIAADATSSGAHSPPPWLPSSHVECVPRWRGRSGRAEAFYWQGACRRWTCPKCAEAKRKRLDWWGQRFEEAGGAWVAVQTVGDGSTWDERRARGQREVDYLAGLAGSVARLRAALKKRRESHGVEGWIGVLSYDTDGRVTFACLVDVDLTSTRSKAFAQWTRLTPDVARRWLGLLLRTGRPVSTNIRWGSVPMDREGREHRVPDRPKTARIWFGGAWAPPSAKDEEGEEDEGSWDLVEPSVSDEERRALDRLAEEEGEARLFAYGTERPTRTVDLPASPEAFMEEVNAELVDRGYAGAVLAWDVYRHSLSGEEREKRPRPYPLAGTPWRALWDAMETLDAEAWRQERKTTSPLP